jgi:hypothetical protein
MRHLKHSPGLILAVLFALTLLAGCSGSASAPAATPTSTAPPVAGEFVGVTNKVDAIGLSTNGQQLIAYACDGTTTHALTFSVWFKGAVSHNAVSLFAKNGEHLVATLTPQSATGTVTLTGGKSFSFTATAAATHSAAGLYRDEQTFAGVRYLAGWIISNPPTATPTPASSASASIALLRLFLNPTMPEVGADGCNDGYCLRIRGGILNEQTGALLSPLTTLINQDIAARQMPVPNLGTFTMKQCQQGQC